jgi:hypothetical protein
VGRSDRIAQSEWSIRLGASLPDDINRAGFQNTRIEKNYVMDKVRKGRLCQFSHAVFSHLQVTNLAMQAVVWLGMFRFSVI